MPATLSFPGKGQFQSTGFSYAPNQQTSCQKEVLRVNAPRRLSTCRHIAWQMQFRRPTWAIETNKENLLGAPRTHIQHTGRGRCSYRVIRCSSHLSKSVGSKYGTLVAPGVILYSGPLRRNEYLHPWWRCQRFHQRHYLHVRPRRLASSDS